MRLHLSNCHSSEQESIFDIEPAMTSQKTQNQAVGGKDRLTVFILSLLLRAATNPLAVNELTAAELILCKAAESSETKN